MSPRSDAPVFCEHANENPAICRCPPDCYCQTRTCKDRHPLERTSLPQPAPRPRTAWDHINENDDDDEMG
jgi:hypothetical protein